MCAAIRWAIEHWTSLETEDYVRLLHLRDEYAVARFRVDEGDWVGKQTVATTDVAAEGIVVLGIECPGGHFVGVPAPDVEIRPDDVLLVYGRSQQVAALEQRGDDAAAAEAHNQAILERRARENAERASVGR
jgi:Trk K+ transport system NAD-binding subunit